MVLFCLCNNLNVHIFSHTDLGFCSRLEAKSSGPAELCLAHGWREVGKDHFKACVFFPVLGTLKFMFSRRRPLGHSVCQASLEYRPYSLLPRREVKRSKPPYKRSWAQTHLWQLSYFTAETNQVIIKAREWLSWEKNGRKQHWSCADPWSVGRMQREWSLDPNSVDKTRFICRTYLELFYCVGRINCTLKERLEHMVFSLPGLVKQAHNFTGSLAKELLWQSYTMQ